MVDVLVEKRARKKPGFPPRAIVQFPPPLFDEWDEPGTFVEALELHMRRHGDTSYRLHRALIQAGARLDERTLGRWRAGRKSPNSASSMKVLAQIESRYRLKAGYFKSKLRNASRSTRQEQIEGISEAEQRRLSWHLPDDFADRSKAEQSEIIEWIRRVIISGATDYRQFLATAVKHKYGIRFSTRAPSPEDIEETEVDPDVTASALAAPPRLAGEMADLIQCSHCSQDQAYACAWFSFLDIDNPLAADTDMTSEGSLVPALAAAVLTDSSAKVTYGADAHADWRPPMSSRTLGQCNRSLTISNVIDRLHWI